MADDLRPSDVKRMGLVAFARRFGFRPRDAHEKAFFAATGKRPTPMEYEAIKAGLVGEIHVAEWNMEEADEQ